MQALFAEAGTGLGVGGIRDEGLLLTAVVPLDERGQAAHRGAVADEDDLVPPLAVLSHGLGELWSRVAREISLVDLPLAGLGLEPLDELAVLIVPREDRSALQVPHVVDGPAP